MPKRRALVAHPHIGSVWLENAKIDGRDYVVGEVYAQTIFGHDLYETMNFPASCVRKWDPPVLLCPTCQGAGGAAGCGAWSSCSNCCGCGRDPMSCPHVDCEDPNPQEVL